MNSDANGRCVSMYCVFLVFNLCDFAVKVARMNLKARKQQTFIVKGHRGKGSRFFSNSPLKGENFYLLFEEEVVNMIYFQHVLQWLQIIKN